MSLASADHKKEKAAQGFGIPAGRASPVGLPLATFVSRVAKKSEPQFLQFFSLNLLADNAALSALAFLNPFGFKNLQP